MIVGSMDAELWSKVTDFLLYCISLGTEPEIMLGLPGEYNDYCMVIEVQVSDKKSAKSIEKKFKEMFGDDGYFGYIALRLVNKSSESREHEYKKYVEKIWGERYESC